MRRRYNNNLRVCCKAGAATHHAELANSFCRSKARRLRRHSVWAPKNKASMMARACVFLCVRCGYMMMMIILVVPYYTNINIKSRAYAFICIKLNWILYKDSYICGYNSQLICMHIPNTYKYMRYGGDEDTFPAVIFIWYIFVVYIFIYSIRYTHLWIHERLLLRAAGDVCSTINTRLWSVILVRLEIMLSSDHAHITLTYVTWYSSRFRVHRADIWL